MDKYLFDVGDILFYVSFMTVCLHFCNYTTIQFVIGTVIFFGILAWRRLNKKEE